MINGKTMTVAGIDLVYKSIKAMSQPNTIAVATFTTKAINFVFTVANTISPYCSIPPTGTVAMKDVTQTGLTIYNLELRECNEGALFADIELIRGIMDTKGQFTHVRSEYLKSIQLGNIGCDPSCMKCNSTTSTSCEICSNSSSNYAFLYMG